MYNHDNACQDVTTYKLIPEVDGSEILDGLVDNDEATGVITIHTDVMDFDIDAHYEIFVDGVYQ